MDWFEQFEIILAFVLIAVCFYCAGYGDGLRDVCSFCMMARWVWSKIRRSSTRDDK